MTDLADRLATVANDLRIRVREQHPALVHAWLREQVAGVDEWVGLCMFLAVAVPEEPTWHELTGWFAPRPDPSYVDEIAVERACCGERVSLTRAERNAVIDRLTRQGVGGQRIADRIGVSRRLVERRRAVTREEAA